MQRQPPAFEGRRLTFSNKKANKMPPTMILTGQTGRTYEYQVHPVDATWTDHPGCYVFIANTMNSLYASSTSVVLYIGQTDSLQRRIGEHKDDVWAAAVRHGASHVLARVVLNEAERLAEERDLIRSYLPRLNTQHVPDQPPLGLAGLYGPKNKLLGL